MNFVILSGNICNDLEVKETSNGNKYLKFSLAVRNGKDKNGNELTEFVNCVAWNKSAELINQYSGKGCKIAINGKLHSTQVEKDGKKVTYTDILVNEFEFLGGKNNASSGTTPAPNKSLNTTEDNDYDVPFEM